MIRCALHGPRDGLSRAFIKVSEEVMFERIHFTGPVGPWMSPHRTGLIRPHNSSKGASRCDEIQIVRPLGPGPEVSSSVSI